MLHTGGQQVQHLLHVCRNRRRSTFSSRPCIRPTSEPLPHSCSLSTCAPASDMSCLRILALDERTIDFGSENLSIRLGRMLLRNERG